MSKIYVGDVGTLISIDCGCDVSDLTAAKVIIRTPAGVEAEYTGTLSGTNFVIYTLLGTEMPAEGEYKIMVEITTSDGVWSGEPDTIQVYNKFQ